MARLLLVEDERLLRWALKSKLQQAGHTVDDVDSLGAADVQLAQQRFQVLVLDVNLPDGHGIDFLQRQRERLTETSVIVMTADGSIADAVRAIKLGAEDFLSKPVDTEELLRLIDQALEARRNGLEAEVSRRARERQGRNYIAESPAMKHVFELAGHVASSSSTTVLIHGETGAGKEVVARYIHQLSPRANAPLQALNCAALPDHLVESELFGYEKGAFTDAKTSRKGLFELADGGTVVLDEIGEIPLPVQAKLLRVLEERTFRRLGGTRETQVDVRVLALTNRDLREQVAKGTFREDLYYRINVFPIHVPPLRDRREDIVPLALHFAQQFGLTARKHFTSLSTELQSRLLAHRWTGNVRELRNLMERAAIMEAGPVLLGSSLPLGSVVEHEHRLTSAPASEEIVPLDEVEFTMVLRALRATGGNQSQAARMLKVSRDQLRYRIKRYREEGRMAEELETAV